MARAYEQAASAEEEEVVKSIPLSYLPKSIADIAEVCGMEVAEALVQHFGGVRIWVPRTWHATVRINAIGEEHAKALCAFIGGDELTVPKSLMSPEARHELIKSLDADGIHQRDIAMRLGCTERTVRRELWRKGPRQLKSRTRRLIDQRQIDLEDWLGTGTK